MRIEAPSHPPIPHGASVGPTAPGDSKDVASPHPSIKQGTSNVPSASSSVNGGAHPAGTAANANANGNGGKKGKRSFFSSNITFNLPRPQPTHAYGPSSQTVLAALDAPKAIDPKTNREAKSLRRDMGKAEATQSDATTTPPIAGTDALPSALIGKNSMAVAGDADGVPTGTGTAQGRGQHGGARIKGQRTTPRPKKAARIFGQAGPTMKKVGRPRGRPPGSVNKKNPGKKRKAHGTPEQINARMAHMREVRRQKLLRMRAAKEGGEAAVAAVGDPNGIAGVHQSSTPTAQQKGKGKRKARMSDTVDLSRETDSDEDAVDTLVGSASQPGPSMAPGKPLTGFTTGKKTGVDPLRKKKDYMSAGLYCQDENAVSPNKYINKVLQQRQNQSGQSAPQPAKRGRKPRALAPAPAPSGERLTFPPLPYDYGEQHFFGQEHDFVLPYNIAWEAQHGSLNDKKRPAQYQKIRNNIFPERARFVSEHKAICRCDPSSGCGDNCINRIMSYLCGKDCPAGDACTNKSLAKRARPNTKVLFTGARGFGLVAMEDIKEGQFVIDYRGEVINMNTFFDRIRNEYRGDKNFYALAYDQDEVIDAGLRGNEARFINHGCSPNLEVRKYQTLGDGLEEYEVGMWAIRDIKKGEELFYDYNFESFGVPATNDLRVKCECGAPNCVGFLSRKAGEKSAREIAADLKAKEAALAAKALNARAKHAAKSAVRKASIKPLKPRRFPKASPLAKKLKPKTLAIGTKVIDGSNAAGPSSRRQRQITADSPLARSEALAAARAAAAAQAQPPVSAATPERPVERLSEAQILLPTPPGTSLAPTAAPSPHIPPPHRLDFTHGPLPTAPPTAPPAHLLPASHQPYAVQPVRHFWQSSGPRSAPSHPQHTSAPPAHRPFPEQTDPFMDRRDNFANSWATTGPTPAPATQRDLGRMVHPPPHFSSPAFNANIPVWPTPFPPFTTGPLRRMLPGADQSPALSRSNSSQGGPSGRMGSVSSSHGVYGETEIDFSTRSPVRGHSHSPMSSGDDRDTEFNPEDGYYPRQDTNDTTSETADGRKRRGRKSAPAAFRSRPFRPTAQNDPHWIPGTAEKVEVRKRLPPTPPVAGNVTDPGDDENRKPRISGWAEWLRKKAGETPRTLQQWEEERMKRRRGKVWMLNMIKEFGILPEGSTNGIPIIPTNLSMNLKSNRGYVRKKADGTTTTVTAGPGPQAIFDQYGRFMVEPAPPGENKSGEAPITFRTFDKEGFRTEISETVTLSYPQPGFPTVAPAPVASGYGTQAVANVTDTPEIVRESVDISTPPAEPAPAPRQPSPPREQAFEVEAAAAEQTSAVPYQKSPSRQQIELPTVANDTNEEVSISIQVTHPASQPAIQPVSQPVEQAQVSVAEPVEATQVSASTSAPWPIAMASSNTTVTVEAPIDQPKPTPVVEQEQKPVPPVHVAAPIVAPVAAPAAAPANAQENTAAPAGSVHHGPPTAYEQPAHIPNASMDDNHLTTKRKAIRARNGAPMGWAYVPYDQTPAKAFNPNEELPPRRKKGINFASLESDYEVGGSGAMRKKPRYTT